MTCQKDREILFLLQYRNSIIANCVTVTHPGILSEYFQHVRDVFDGVADDEDEDDEERDPGQSPLSPAQVLVPRPAERLAQQSRVATSCYPHEAHFH